MCTAGAIAFFGGPTAGWRSPPTSWRKNCANGASAQGDRVVLWGDDCAEWVVSFFACVLRGAVVVPMDRTAALEFVQRVCRQVEPKLCIASREQPQIDPSLPSMAFEDLPRPDRTAQHVSGSRCRI